jgi:hypothetical protein
MFSRLVASFRLARSSWRVLRTDKKLIAFPVLSGLSCLLVLAGFVLPLALRPQWLEAFVKHTEDGTEIALPPWSYAVAFAYYVCNYFVIIFFNAALVSCALTRFNGGTPTLRGGLAAAARRLPQVLAWALVSATVGLLLQFLEGLHEKLGWFLRALFGTAWGVMTYFVVPAMVVEGVGPFGAVLRSLSILRRTWGEALVGRLGLGFYLLLLALPGVLLLAGGIYLGTQVPAAGIAAAAVALVYFLGLSAAGSAVNGIFVGALYQYAAQGQVPEGFDAETMKHAFRAK